MLSAYKVYRYDHLESPAVTAGNAAVLIGAQNGLFPDMGYAIPGEMGGLWAGEKKVCDGFFLAIDDVPLLKADACELSPTATAFHYRMQKEELHVVRRQFIADGIGGCVIELTIENLRSAPRMAEVSFTVRTDILTVAAARGEDGLELGRDVGEYDEQTQAFYARDSRNPWHAVWGADKGNRVLQADLPQTVYGFGNTQGKGINGRLFYRLRVAAGGQATMRLFVAGGFASRSKAEEALETLRSEAQALDACKQTRMAEHLALSETSLPESMLMRCFNWAKVCEDWLTRALPGGGMALCADLPEHPVLYGDDWALGLSALLPQGGVARVMEMLRTLVRVSEAAQLAPGRLARCVSLGGRVTQVGGVRESAQFVALVHRTLLWSGDAAFAKEMLPMTGLCVSYLRRSTRGFTDVQAQLLGDLRRALEGQAYILRLLGEDDAEMCTALESLPVPEEAPLAPDAPLEEAALWHGAQGHVEQMIGCLMQMAERELPGLPGALRTQKATPGVLLEAKAAAGFVWPLVSHLFGVQPDAGAKVIRWNPHTPIGWDGWVIERLFIGEACFDVRSERVSPSKARYTIRTDAEGWRVLAVDNGEEKLLDLSGEVTLEMGD